MTHDPRQTGSVIRLVLADDHDMVLESLRRRLDRENDLMVVGTVTSGAAVAPAVVEWRPDVVVLDFRLPDIDGVAVTRQVLAESPGTRILMLTGSGDDAALPAAMDAGCVGYLDKTAPFEHLVSGIRRAAAGELVLSAADLGAVLAAKERPATPDLLTPREAEVLRLMAEGHVNRAIAEQLSVSVDTVRTHVQNLLSKLGAHSRLEAVAEARRRGFLD
jgi:DNA-binding NarL/FixJ family response regulator